MSEQVWWCEKHNSSMATMSFCNAVFTARESVARCDRVERLLVDPVSTLIVEKGEDGWPEWAMRTLYDAVEMWGYPDKSLDALKVAYDLNNQRRNGHL